MSGETNELSAREQRGNRAVKVSRIGACWIAVLVGTVAVGCGSYLRVGGGSSNFIKTMDCTELRALIRASCPEGLRTSGASAWESGSTANYSGNESSKRTESRTYYTTGTTLLEGDEALDDELLEALKTAFEARLRNAGGKASKATADDAEQYGQGYVLNYVEGTYRGEIRVRIVERKLTIEIEETNPMREVL